MRGYALALIALTLAAVAAVTLAAVGSIDRLSDPADAVRAAAHTAGGTRRRAERLCGRVGGYRSDAAWRRRRGSSMRPAGCSPEPR